MRAVADSGATSSCIGAGCPWLENLVYEVVDAEPHAAMRVASSAVLNVTSVVNIKFCDKLALAGFRQDGPGQPRTVLPQR